VVDRPRDSLVVDHRGFPNARGAKQVHLAASLALGALRWRLRTRGRERFVVVDAAYVSALPGVLAVTRGVTRVAIFADVYTFMADVADASDRSGARYRAMRRLVARTYRAVDRFVLLTRQMDAVVNPERRPSIVMEGLVDADMAAADNVLASKDEHLTVLYSGALRSEYGLANLVEGFRAWDAPDARLVVYGGGDYASAVEAAAAADARVEFRGTVPNAEVVAAQQRAWLLVNPRPADQEFTAYSFPSKNMEYLVSGTAVLTTRLPGMPADYDEHVLTIEGSSAADITSALERAAALGRTELHARGERARQFVLDRKNHSEQGRRIMELALGETRA
jgi:glycosyltransferase involved in cell wall biosynthesis